MAYHNNAPECRCSSHASRHSIFRQSTPTSRLVKRYRSHRRTFSDAEYPEITANMASRSRRKQPLVSSNESDTEPKGVYRHTRTWTGAVTLISYSVLARGIEVNDSHSAVAESQASNSFIEKEAFAYMTNIPEETARRFEQQAQV